MPQPPTVGASAPGSAYLLVGLTDSRLLRISDDGVTVLPPPVSPRRTSKSNLVGRPDGTLWISDWEGVRVLAPDDGSTVALRDAKGGELFDQLRVLARDDAWAVSTAIEWEVLHYDGRSWAPVARRADFPGRFSANEFTGLQVTSGGTWVGSWNGLWRRVGGTWQRVDGPADGSDGPMALHVFRDRLLAQYGSGLHFRESEGWRRVEPSMQLARLWAVSDTGLWAGQDADGADLVLASTAGGRCVVPKEVVPGAQVRSVTIDARARVWVTTDDQLLVLDHHARLLARWSQGTLDGLTGRPGVLAVTGSGPSRLPPQHAPRTVDLVGRLVTFKSRAGLAGASLELCSTLRNGAGCAGASFSRSAVSKSDGSFRLSDVPEGEYWVHVTPPDGLEDCRTPFRRTGFDLATTTACGPATRPGRSCDLGVRIECAPFERSPGTRRPH